MEAKHHLSLRETSLFRIQVISLFFVMLVTAMVTGKAKARTAICASDIDAYLQGSGLAGEGAHFVKWGKYFDVDPRLIIGIANAESSLGRSPCGANSTGTWNAWGWFGGSGSCWTYFEPGLDADTNRTEFNNAPGFVAGQGITMATGWEDGIFWVTRSMKKEYLDAGQNTVDLIQSGSHKYCASGCTNWVSNVKATFTALGGDPNQLNYPGDGGNCGGSTPTLPTVTFNEGNKNRWFGPADVNSQVVSWSLSGDVSGGWCQSWDADPGDGGCFHSTSGFLAFGYIPDAQREGQHTAYVRTRKSDNSPGELKSSGWYGYDSKAPVVTLTSGHANGSTYTTPQRMTWSISDAGSGLYRWGQAWDAEPGQQFSSNEGYFDLPEGTHTLHVKTWDNLGNAQDWTFGPFTFAPDTTAPTISISAPATDTCLPAATVSWSAQDSGVGVDKTWYSLDGGGFVEAGSVALPHGTHSIVIKAQDKAGNIAQQTFGPFVVDATAPTAALDLLASSGHYSAALAWSAPAEDGCSAVASYNVYARRSGAEKYARLNEAPLNATTFNASGLTNGARYDFAVAAVDGFGREGAQAEVPNILIGLRGDVSGDGVLDISDVLIAVNIIATPNNYPASQRAQADYDDDGDVDGADVTAMKNAILGV